ncbi:hypothetical protein URH17368_1615 [Alicyclobacillus hesperidum URH17-3-68]|nr:hypothetical protein URH17368_1615 [Alicyclobacillus hesperidum URH17-3-68]
MADPKAFCNKLCQLFINWLEAMVVGNSHHQKVPPLLG